MQEHVFVLGPVLLQTELTGHALGFLQALMGLQLPVTLPVTFS
jgi:hypothetical protein